MSRNILLLVAFLLLTSGLYAQSGGLAFWSKEGNKFVNIERFDHFLGTHNNQPLIIKTNNIERMRIHESGILTVEMDATFNANVNIANNIELGRNLNLGGNLSVGENTSIARELSVGGNTNLQSDLAVDRNTSIGETLAVTGATTLDNTLNVTGDSELGSDLTVRQNSRLDQELSVGGNTNLQSDLAVDRNTSIGETLAVTGATSLSNTLNVSGDTELGSNLSVGQNGRVEQQLSVGGNTNLQSDLAVDQNTSIGETLAVTGATSLSNTLGVSGNTNLDSNLVVGQNTTLGAQLTVGGATSLGNALTVAETASIGKDLNVTDSLTVGQNTLINGILTVETEADVERLRVQTDATIDNQLNVNQLATIQQLQVEDNARFRDTLETEKAIFARANLHVDQQLFADGHAFLNDRLSVGSDALFQGRFGLGELAENASFNISAPPGAEFPFWFRVAGNTDLKFSMDDAGQLFAQSAIDDGDKAFSDGYGLVLQARSQGAFVILGNLEDLTATDDVEDFQAHSFLTFAESEEEDGIYGYLQATKDASDPESGAVTLQSGGADYAEWLPKQEENQDFQAGEVVGLYAGKISRQTTGADRIMVISSAPIVLGNMPAKREKANYAMVAFMGQAPVKVRGTVALGDYILADGRGNGIARAVAPEKMALADYGYILGVAWEASEVASVKTINTAIGLNQNDLYQEVKRQQAELSALKAEVQAIRELLQMEVETTPEAGTDPLRDKE